MLFSLLESAGHAFVIWMAFFDGQLTVGVGWIDVTGRFTSRVCRRRALVQTAPEAGSAARTRLAELYYNLSYRLAT